MNEEMGGAPSKTRKLTVENEDPANIIKVSEDVIDRIRSSQVNKATRLDRVTPEGFTSPPGYGQPSSQTVLYLNEPSMTSLQLRQAHVVDLKKNDDYWQNRLRAMESNHQRMNEILDQEYKKAVDEVKGKQLKQTKSGERPCVENMKAVTECYRCYPNETMRCAKLVQAFQECVDSKRACLLEGRG